MAIGNFLAGNFRMGVMFEQAADYNSSDLSEGKIYIATLDIRSVM